MLRFRFRDNKKGDKFTLLSGDQFGLENIAQKPVAQWDGDGGVFEWLSHLNRDVK